MPLKHFFFTFSARTGETKTPLLAGIITGCKNAKKYNYDPTSSKTTSTYWVSQKVSRSLGSFAQQRNNCVWSRYFVPDTNTDSQKYAVIWSILIEKKIDLVIAFQVFHFLFFRNLNQLILVRNRIQILTPSWHLKLVCYVPKLNLKLWIFLGHPLSWEYVYNLLGLL